MNPNIEAIFLDVGNTLRILVKDEPYQAQARQQIAIMTRSQEPADILCAGIDVRYKIYRKWAFENLAEASESELWTRWLLPDYPPEIISTQAVELTYQYRQSMGRRVMQRDSKQVVIELNQRGYSLGIISNVITSQEIPNWLESDGLSQYFKSIVLSSSFGRRKPHPSIYLEAARKAGVDPARSVYVGDNPSRDVLGTRQAGFGMAILMLEPGDTEEGLLEGENRPDLIIHEFNELLDIFPRRIAKPETACTA